MSTDKLKESTKTLVSRAKELDSRIAMDYRSATSYRRYFDQARTAHASCERQTSDCVADGRKLGILGGQVLSALHYARGQGYVFSRGYGYLSLSQTGRARLGVK